jgi:hypothetical protein
MMRCVEGNMLPLNKTKTHAANTLGWRSGHITPDLDQDGHGSVWGIGGPMMTFAHGPLPGIGLKTDGEFRLAISAERVHIANIREAEHATEIV